MTGTGLCSVCGTASQLYSCSLCGRLVCGNCLTVKGVCRDCLSGRKMKVEESVDAQELARRMLDRGVGK